MQLRLEIAREWRRPQKLGNPKIIFPKINAFELFNFNTFSKLNLIFYLIFNKDKLAILDPITGANPKKNMLSY